MEVNTLIQRVSTDPASGEHRAAGHVLRVFDSCDRGLVPVPFARAGAVDRFTLPRRPHGDVWAEVVDDLTTALA